MVVTRLTRNDARYGGHRPWKLNSCYTEVYRSGHNGADSNFFWKFRPFRPLKMSTAQGFARVRISQFHIVLACFSCILPEQGLHLRYTESCPRGRRCDTRNHVICAKNWIFSKWRRIEAVITSSTRNLLPMLLPQILQTLVFQALRWFYKSSYFRLFYPAFLSCSRPCFLGDFKIELGLTYSEGYRSGHNENDSKSFDG